MDVNVFKRRFKRILTARIAFHIYFWMTLWIAWIIIAWSETASPFFTFAYSFSIVALAAVKRTD